MKHTQKYIIENVLTQAHWDRFVKDRIQESVLNKLSEASEEDKERLIRRVHQHANAAGIAIRLGKNDRYRHHQQKTGETLHLIGRTHFADEKGNLSSDHIQAMKKLHSDKEETIRRSAMTRYNRTRPGQAIDVKA